MIKIIDHNRFLQHTHAHAHTHTHTPTAQKHI